MKDLVADVITPFQHKILEFAKDYEYYGDPKLVINILRVLDEYFSDELEATMRGFPEEEDYTIE